jgi:hypothetical protein
MESPAMLQYFYPRHLAFFPHDGKTVLRTISLQYSSLSYLLVKDWFHSSLSSLHKEGFYVTRKFNEEFPETAFRILLQKRIILTLILNLIRVELNHRVVEVLFQRFYEAQNEAHSSLSLTLIRSLFRSSKLTALMVMRRILLWHGPYYPCVVELEFATPCGQNSSLANGNLSVGEDHARDSRPSPDTQIGITICAIWCRKLRLTITQEGYGPQSFCWKQIKLYFSRSNN